MGDLYSNLLKSERIEDFKSRLKDYVSLFGAIIALAVLLLAFGFVSHFDQATDEQIIYAKQNPAVFYGMPTKVNVIRRLCALKNLSEKLVSSKDECATAGNISECVKIKSGFSLDGLEISGVYYEAIPENVRPNAFQCARSRK